MTGRDSAHPRNARSIASKSFLMMNIRALLPGKSMNITGSVEPIISTAFSISFYYGGFAECIA
jgi:hypothetical protein